MTPKRQLWAAVTALVAGCGGKADTAVPDVAPLDLREPCAERNPLRNLYWGDLHVHTEYSFDAWVFDVRTTADQAYRFAKGEPVALPPLDAAGTPTQTVQLARPLDFAAVTDHAEYLGEVGACQDEGSPAFDHITCVQYREAEDAAIYEFGLGLTHDEPERMEFCGDDVDCLAGARDVWTRLQQAAEDHYDRSTACDFTTFVAYEYSAATNISNLHRNVLFRNTDVPDQPASYFEYPTPQDLWGALQSECLDAGGRCDVLAIPHNSNWSNGTLFDPIYPQAASAEEERAQAEARVAMEPLVEVIQHKGDSECLNGFAGILGEPDELCDDFEKLRTIEDAGDCGDGTGVGAMGGIGCLSRRDFVRGALLEGLKEQDRIGANPFRMGLMASTDTHNGIPGAVEERDYAGHWGNNEDEADKRLAFGGITPGGVLFGPGGLTAIWSEDNSRDALFDAMRAREVYGTSGPRIVVRTFGGFDLDPGMCDAGDFVEQGYDRGVPMGGTLDGAAAGGAPRFAITAERDPESTVLQRVQVIKGVLREGETHQFIYDVAGDPDNEPTVDLATCDPVGSGFDSLCTVWEDPDFDPQELAFYYVRVVENPTCRWTGWQCMAMDEAVRPDVCSDPTVPWTTQERAWTSPIWYEPA